MKAIHHRPPQLCLMMEMKTAQRVHPRSVWRFLMFAVTPSQRCLPSHDHCKKMKLILCLQRETIGFLMHKPMGDVTQATHSDMKLAQLKPTRGICIVLSGQGYKKCHGKSNWRGKWFWKLICIHLFKCQIKTCILNLAHVFSVLKIAFSNKLSQRGTLLWKISPIDADVKAPSDKW